MYVLFFLVIVTLYPDSRSVHIMTQFHSLLQLSNIPLHIRTTSPLSIPLLIFECLDCCKKIRFLWGSFTPKEVKQIAPQIYTVSNTGYTHSPRPCSLWPKVGSGCSLLGSKWGGQVVGKGSFLYFGCWQWEGVGGGQILARGPASPTLHHQPRSKRFERQKEEATCRNGTVSSESSWNWSCSGSDRVILTVFSTVSFQFQGWFVLISLRPVLRIVAA